MWLAADFGAGTCSGHAPSRLTLRLPTLFPASLLTRAPPQYRQLRRRRGAFVPPLARAIASLLEVLPRGDADFDAEAADLVPVSLLRLRRLRRAASSACLLAAVLNRGGFYTAPPAPTHLPTATNAPRSHLQVVQQHVGDQTFLFGGALRSCSSLLTRAGNTFAILDLVRPVGATAGFRNGRGRGGRGPPPGQCQCSHSRACSSADVPGPQAFTSVA